MITERLMLRPIRYEDTQKVYELTSQMEVAKYMRFDQHKNQEETKEMVKDYIENVANLAFAIEEQGTEDFVGVIVLKQQEEEGYYSLSTFLSPTVWNKGYSTEIMESLKKYGKEAIGARVFEAYVVADNKGSCKVLERSEFKVVRELNFPELEAPLRVYQLEL